MKRRRFGKMMIASGVCLILAAAGLWWHNQLESERAGEAATDALAELSMNCTEAKPPAETFAEELGIQSEMPTREIDGIHYLGILEIPVLGLELPVISSWSEGNAEMAPCRYSGSVYSGDFIICAHNYKSHFGNLPSLEPDDDVIFTDVDGNRFSFQVAELEVLDGTDLEQMETGEWDLTLFTCTSGGKARFTLRCKKIS